MKMKQTRDRPSVSGSDRVLRSRTDQHVNPPSKVTKSKKRRARADPWAPKRKPNPDAKPRPPPRSHFTCRICIEEKPLNEFVKWVRPIRDQVATVREVPFGCLAHLARNPQNKSIDPVCKTCIGRSFSAKLDMLDVRQVSRGCLVLGCDTNWEQQFITRFLDSEALEKFNVAMFKAWKTDVQPPLVTCVSPTCNAIGLPDVFSPGYPQVSCYTCATRYCAQCEVPWHKDLSCAEYSAKAVNENVTESEQEILNLMQRKDGRRCPSCQLVITKNGGCSSMLVTRRSIPISIQDVD